MEDVIGAHRHQIAIATTAIALLALGTVAILVGCSPGETDAAVSQAEEEDSTPVAGYELQPRDLSRTASVSGTIEPLETYRLSSYADGVLTTLNVQEGDRVDAGDVLAATQLEEYRAERDRAEAEVEKLKRELERKRPLAERDAIQIAEIEQLEGDLNIAQREVHVWNTRIDLGTLVAPTDAVVTKRHVDPGTTVAANEQLLELADVSELVVPVRMSERDVGAIDRDEPVEVRLDAYPDEPMEASIRRVFPGADESSRRVTVELKLDDVADGVEPKPGFRARATIEVDRRVDRLAVPSQSLLASDGDDEIVYVIDEDKLVTRSVETGVQRRNWTEIVDGLEAGDVIVGTNPTNLREGTRVHVSQWVGDDD